MSRRVLTDLNSVEQASWKVVKVIQHLQFLVVYLWIRRRPRILQNNNRPSFN